MNFSCKRRKRRSSPTSESFGDKYVLGEPFGFGHMSEVYVAIQAGIGRNVALRKATAQRTRNQPLGCANDSSVKRRLQARWIIPTPSQSSKRSHER